MSTLCHDCHGSGVCAACDGDARTYLCEACDTSGECSTCDGSGWIDDGDDAGPTQAGVVAGRVLADLVAAQAGAHGELQREHAELADRYQAVVSELDRLRAGELRYAAVGREMVAFLRHLESKHESTETLSVGALVGALRLKIKPHVPEAVP